MRILSLGFTLLFFSYTNAGSLTLNWNFPALYMSDTSIASNPSILSFKAFSKTGTAGYNYSNPIWTGANPPAKVIGLQSGTMYCFVLRAHKSNNNMDSGDSNETCGRVPKLNPPSGFQLIDYKAELDMDTRLIHYLGYYSNPESSENMTMETTQIFSEL